MPTTMQEDNLTTAADVIVIGAGKLTIDGNLVRQYYWECTDMARYLWHTVRQDIP